MKTNTRRHLTFAATLFTLVVGLLALQPATTANAAPGWYSPVPKGTQRLSRGDIPGVTYVSKKTLPVYAVRAGVARYYRSSWCGNWSVEIDHGKVNGARMRSRYCSLASRKIGHGKRVKARQLIGYGGRQGGAAARYSHPRQINLVIFKNGRSVNPTYYVPRP